MVRAKDKSMEQLNNDKKWDMVLGIGLLILISVLIIGVFYLSFQSFTYLYNYKPVERVCSEERVVVSIEPVVLENFWGKEIKTVVKYDNGSFEDYSYYSHGIGYKDCIKYY